jgi:hypothetical protein
MKIVLSQFPGFINHEVDSVSTRGKEVVLKGSGTIIGVDNVTGLLMNPADPIGEFPGIWDGGGQENMVNRLWKHDQTFLPDNSTL